MAINFNALPQDRPNQIAAPGTYYGTILEATPKVSKAGSNMLALKIELQDYNGKKAGILFDNIIESEKAFLLFKIAKFCNALDIVLSGSFELKDLAKIVVNKKLIVDVKHGEFNGNTKAEVDMSKGIFYPLSMASEIFGNTAGLAATGTTGINASDAYDAMTPSSDIDEAY